MAEIKIIDLNLKGNDLFDDDEGFMDELDEGAFEQVKGGTMASPIIGPDGEPIYPKTEPIDLPFTMVILWFNLKPSPINFNIALIVEVFFYFEHNWINKIISYSYST